MPGFDIRYRTIKSIQTNTGKERKMGIKSYKPYTSSRRNMTGVRFLRDHKEDTGEIFCLRHRKNIQEK